MILDPEHPLASGSGYVLEHLALAFKALGKPLPEGAEVHHVNGKKADNRPQNLVVCQDHEYHHLLHLRQQALRDCGNASLRRCTYCGQYDDPSNMYIRPRQSARHRSCATKADTARDVRTLERLGPLASPLREPDA